MKPAFDEFGYGLPYTFRSPFATAEYHRVVGIAEKRKSSAPELLVQFIKHHVAQQRTQRTTLRCSFLAAHEQAVYHYATPKIFVYKRDNPHVLDCLEENFYELAMADRIKEAIKIQVDYVLVAVRNYGLRLFQRIMTATPRTEAEAVPAELFLIDGSQNLVDGLLHHAVYHGRYP